MPHVTPVTNTQSNGSLLELILKVAEDQNATLSNQIDVGGGADARLYGSGGPLDSIALVRFIVELEAAIEEELGVSIVLADTRALSQEQSPFRTIETLAAYTALRVAELRTSPSSE